MELHEGLQAARAHDLDSDLDEKIARIRLGITVLYLSVAFTVTLIAIWILNLEGRM